MTSPPLLRLAATAGVLALTLGACGSVDKPRAVSTVQGATGATTDKVEVKDFTFNPEVTTVTSGTTVTWTFRDDVPHTVEADDPSSELKPSPELEAGGTYTFKFTKPGTVAYHCGIHQSMTGSVVVTA